MEQREALSGLAELIAAAPVNLVSRADRAHVRERHIDESAALGKALPLEPGQRWVDLGTGGGLPGLVLAIMYPSVHWVLVDSVGKKLAQVERFAHELGLVNVETARGRAEELAHQPRLRAAFDGVVARAVARLPTLVEWCRGFVANGGLVAAVKGPTWEAELEEAQPLLSPLGLGAVHTVELPAGDRTVAVVTMRAADAAPASVPRAPGVAQRHLLGEP
jgi:16S rRNA (guanine527-N7)-methyltransferase